MKCELSASKLAATSPASLVFAEVEGRDGLEAGVEGLAGLRVSESLASVGIRVLAFVNQLRYA